jgi:hypothetical protein
VLALADNDSLRWAMGNAARASVLERGWESIIDQLVNVHYCAVLRAGARDGQVAA